MIEPKATHSPSTRRRSGTAAKAPVGVVAVGAGEVKEAVSTVTQSLGWTTSPAASLGDGPGEGESAVALRIPGRCHSSACPSSGTPSVWKALARALQSTPAMNHVRSDTPPLILAERMPLGLRASSRMTGHLRPRGYGV